MAQSSYCMAAHATWQVLALHDVKALGPAALFLMSHSASIYHMALETIQ